MQRENIHSPKIKGTHWPPFTASEQTLFSSNLKGIGTENEPNQNHFSRFEFHWRTWPKMDRKSFNYSFSLAELGDKNSVTVSHDHDVHKTRLQAGENGEIAVPVSTSSPHKRTLLLTGNTSLLSEQEGSVKTVPKKPQLRFLSCKHIHWSCFHDAKKGVVTWFWKYQSFLEGEYRSCVSWLSG